MSKLPKHPLSMDSAAARNAANAPAETPKDKIPTRPMSGSRRKKLYKADRGGSPFMTPAQARRYAAKVARNGYIPK